MKMEGGAYPSNRTNQLSFGFDETSMLLMLFEGSDADLLWLKRQLEKEYAIKLGGDDFFKKVRNVGNLVVP